MDIDELELGTRADGVLKEAGIDTVEDLCLFTRDQLLHLGNFGRKSLDEVENALKERSLCLNRGPANPQLLVSSIKVGPRFNLAFSVLNGDRAGLARYTVRELAQIQDSLLEVMSQSTGLPRKRLLNINGHVGVLRSVHESILEKSQEPSKAKEPQSDPNVRDQQK
jgi:hypothetical protein